MVNDSQSWSDLHRTVFPFILKWTQETESSIAKYWKHAIELGIGENSTWADIQEILHLDTYRDYYYAIGTCPNISRIVKLHFDTTTDLLHYKVQSNIHPVHVTPVPQQKSGPKPADLALPNLETQQNDVAGDTFAFVHHTVYHAIEQWVQENHSIPHPFKAKWSELKYKGITAYTTWERISQIGKYPNYQAYINFIQQCPVIVDQYDIVWDPFPNAITCNPRTTPTTSTIQDIYNTTMKYYGKLKTIAFDYDSTAQSVKNKIGDYTSQVASLETKLLHQTTNAQERFGKYTKHAQDIALSQFEKKMNEYLEDLTTQGYNDFQNKLDDVASNLYSTVQRTLNDMTASAKESWDENIQQAKTTLQEILSENTKPPAQSAVADSSKQDRVPRFPIHRRNVLFPDVDILSQQKPRARNPYADLPQDFKPTDTSRVSEPEQTNHQRDEQETWDRFGPGLHHYQDNPQPLPYVQPHKLVTHVKVPYTGRESSYTWYHTFRSAIRQYGILLIPVEEFRKNKSLCPRQYLGNTIDPNRYREMADPLYQLLALSDTVSAEHTEVRNIIQRHATHTDGYAALYEIMERIHPLLNPDAKLQTPLSINCTDIHDYSNQLHSFFLHQSLENIQYTQRRKINMFLDGLDTSYATAVRQLRQQLRSWPESKKEPPNDLRLEALPRTIETIMNEEHEPGTIRALHRGHTPSKPNAINSPRISKDTVAARVFTDVQCNYCKGFGHKSITCERLAQLLLLQDVLQKISEKTKVKLLEHYTKTQQDRRDRKMKRVKGTVRQLYEDGMAQEADEFLDQCILYADCGHDTDSSSE